MLLYLDYLASVQLDCGSCSNLISESVLQCLALLSASHWTPSFYIFGWPYFREEVSASTDLRNELGMETNINVCGFCVSFSWLRKASVTVGYLKFLSTYLPQRMVRYWGKLTLSLFSPPKVVDMVCLLRGLCAVLQMHPVLA